MFNNPLSALAYSGPHVGQRGQKWDRQSFDRVWRSERQDVGQQGARLLMTVWCRTRETDLVWTPGHHPKPWSWLDLATHWPPSSQTGEVESDLIFLPRMRETKAWGASINAPHPTVIYQCRRQESKVMTERRVASLAESSWVKKFLQT